MNNIYVDELPKRCNECKFQIFIAYHKNGWEHKERFCSLMKNNYDCICSKEKCPLKPITDRLAKEFETLKETFVWGRDNGYLTPKSAVGIVENKIKDLRGKNE